jgi:hypothetical protein
MALLSCASARIVCTCILVVKQLVRAAYVQQSALVCLCTRIVFTSIFFCIGDGSCCPRLQAGVVLCGELFSLGWCIQSDFASWCVNDDAACVQQMSATSPGCCADGNVILCFCFVCCTTGSAWRCCAVLAVVCRKGPLMISGMMHGGLFKSCMFVYVVCAFCCRLSAVHAARFLTA